MQVGHEHNNTPSLNHLCSIECRVHPVRRLVGSKDCQCPDNYSATCGATISRAYNAHNCGHIVLCVWASRDVKRDSASLLTTQQIVLQAVQMACLTSTAWLII